MSSQANRKYGIVRLAGNPVIALPSVSRRERLAGVSRIQGFTLKRALFRHTLRAAVATGLDRLISDPSSNPLATSCGFDFASWLEQESRDLGIETLSATVLWPWPPGSGRRRIYIHLLNPSGCPVAFSKIALDADNSESLLTEQRMLEAFGRCAFRHVRIPRVLSSGLSRGLHYLTIEAVPTTARPARVSLKDYPAEVVTELAGDTTTVSMEKLSSLTWWRRFLDRSTEVPEFLDDIAKNFDGYGVALCRVHGDFEPKNLVKDGSDIWVLDWEQADLSGPRLTDPIRYYILVRSRECKRRPATVLSELLHREGADEATRYRLDVGMALAFLHGAGSADATRLLRYWRPLKGG